MNNLLSGVLYFALVFGTGFVLGVIRIPILVPRIGERYAELVEMPFMAVAIYFAAGYVVKKHLLQHSIINSLAVGFIALALLVTTELLLAVLIQDRNLTEYIASRDKISGSVYLAMLVVYLLMPWLRTRNKIHEPQSPRTEV